MGRPAEETETMTTSKAVLALCLVGAAVAAPQLRLGGLRSVSSVSSVTNQDEVVTNVVSALTPSIAAAVEEALAAQAAAEAARVEAERRAAAQAAAAAAAAAAKATKRPGRKSLVLLRSAPSPQGSLQLQLLKWTRQPLSSASWRSCSHRLDQLLAVPLRLAGLRLLG